MCKWGTTKDCLVYIDAEHSYTGKARVDIKKIDLCIAQIVIALNSQGILTSGSCCGHGKEDGAIWLRDGRVLIIRKQTRQELSSNICTSKKRHKK